MKLIRRIMAILPLVAISFSVSVANTAQPQLLRTKQSAQKSALIKIELAAPHMEVLLEEAASNKVELEVTAEKAVQFEVSQKTLRLKKSALEQLSPNSKVIVRIKGPSLPIEISSMSLTLKALKWKNSLRGSAHQAKIHLENTEGLFDLKSTDLDLESQGSRGEFSVAAKSGKQNYQKFQGLLNLRSGEAEILIRDSDLSLITHTFGGKLEIIDSRGRIDGQIEKSHFDLVKFNGIGEFKTQQGRFKLLAHNSSSLQFVDKKSRFEILKEGPSWVDLRTEAGSFSVDPLKPNLVNHETRAQGFISETKGGGLIKINTQSGRVILK